MPKELYSLEGITKEYISGKVRFKALHGIDLSISAGEVVALTGLIEPKEEAAGEEPPRTFHFNGAEAMSVPAIQDDKLKLVHF